MDVQVEKTGPCEARIQFTAPSDEVATQYKSRLAKAGKQVRMKGFRPGKVPAHVIEKFSGEAVAQDTVRHFLDSALRQAVEQESLRPAAAPRIKEEPKFEKGSELSYAFTIELRPEFELAGYQGLAIEGQAIEVTDEEVEGTIEDVRRQQARPEAAGEDGLPKDGMALAKITFLNGEEEVAAREGLRLSPTTPPMGVEAEAFEAALTGAAEGSTHDFEMVFPDEFERAELRGEKGTCRVELSQVFKLELPPEEDLLKQFGADDAADLRVKVREQVTAFKQRQEEQRLESELFDRVIENHPMDLPSQMLEAQIQARISSAVQQLVGQGNSEEDAQTAVERDAEATRVAAEKSLRALFLVEAIGETESIEVSRDDMIAELRQIAGRNRAQFDEVLKYYQENQLMQQLAVELLERKVRKHIRESAEIATPA
ncbi:trigger factor [Engelhardtia mirabilis]|uniref:Trigger factor n=1 Tax=Engelhardtia mirabilis TaxID=2528011 RepID=A0A518BJG2_9BACT|nr:Trigger factor [Planctomycetes bacterium Pla133]QDV01435.1 Trigger factor [Planctomycetes bacterium Pla86]